MSVCVYDNPKTMRRERWNNGELQWFLDAEFLLLKWGFFEEQIKRNGGNPKPWKAGQFLDGDASAMVKAVKKTDEMDGSADPCPMFSEGDEIGKALGAAFEKDMKEGVERMIYSDVANNAKGGVS